MAVCDRWHCTPGVNEKPTGSTRPGDLRYNIMVRLGNLGCPHDVDDLDTGDLRAHWRAHLYHACG